MSNRFLTPILIATLALSTLHAQSPKSQALLMAMGANGKQTVAYQWKQKTTIIRKGNASAVKLDEIRFDSTGQMQRITLMKPEEKKMAPIKARKVAEVREDVEDVMRLAGRYASPRELAQAIKRGEIWEGPSGLRVQARSLLLPIDEMTMRVNGATYLPVRVDFKTQYEGSLVIIAIDYEQLPNGPSMMARMTVQIPKDDIVVNVESFDFVRLAAASF